MIIDHIAITIHSNYSGVKASIPDICEIVNNTTQAMHQKSKLKLSESSKLKPTQDGGAASTRH